MDWLGRVRGMATAYVLPEYAARFRRYAEYRSRYLWVFNLVAAVLIGALLLAPFVPLPRLVGGGLLGLAVLIWIFPFATSATEEIHGVATSIGLARVGALLLIGIGVMLLLHAQARS